MARALLDSVSQCNLISERLCQLLQLPRHRIDQSIFGVGESKLRVTGSVTTEIKSRVGNFSHTTDFLVLRNITSDIPVVSLPVANWNIPSELPQADPEFNEARRVDLIIGAEHFFTLVEGGRMHFGNSLPILVESVFGWLVSGKADFTTSNQTLTCYMSTLESIDRNLERFWKIEEVDCPMSTPTERFCEEFYKKTVSRDQTGRYVVKYPKRDDFSNLIGESYMSSFRRLQCLERKLDKDEELKEKYHAFIAEF